MFSLLKSLSHSKKHYSLLVLFSSLNLACQTRQPHIHLPQNSGTPSPQSSSSPTNLGAGTSSRTAPHLSSAPHSDSSSTPSSRRSSVSDESSDLSTRDSEGDSEPHLRSSALILQAMGHLVALAPQNPASPGESRLNHFLGIPIMDIHHLLLTNEALLESMDPHWLEPRLQPILDGLTLRDPDGSYHQNFRDMIEALDHSERLVNGITNATQALRGIFNQAQGLIVDAQEYQRREPLRPFRARLIELIQPHMKEIFIRVYEKHHHPDIQMLPPIDAETNPIAHWIARASIAGADSTQVDWDNDLFGLERIDRPDVITPDDELAFKMRIALNVWMNEIQAGHLLLENVQAIRDQLRNAGQIQDFTHELSAPTDAYPETQNRYLSEELRGSEELSPDAIGVAYAIKETLIPAMIEEMNTLSQRLHPGSDEIQEERYQNLSIAKIERDLETLREQAQAQAQAEEAARRAAAERRATIASALGVDYTPDSLLGQTEHEFRQLLRERLLALQGSVTASPEAQNRLTQRVQAYPTAEELVREINRINQSHRRDEELRQQREATRLERERRAQEEARQAQLRLISNRERVARALSIEDSAPLSAEDEAQLRTRLESRYAQAQNRTFTLIPRNRIAGALRSPQRAVQANASRSQLLYDLSFEELLVQVERDAVNPPNRR